MTNNPCSAPPTVKSKSEPRTVGTFLCQDHWLTGTTLRTCCAAWWRQLPKRWPLPADIQSVVPDVERHGLAACHHALTDVIRTEGDSVWTWYIANIAGPYRLSQCKVDRIVANPPWVKMADIQAKVRKREMEDFAATLNLWTGGKQAPHFDIAQLFLRRCRELYLNNPSSDPAGWLVKASASKGGQLGQVP